VEDPRHSVFAYQATQVDRIRHLWESARGRGDQHRPSLPSISGGPCFFRIGRIQTAAIYETVGNVGQISGRGPDSYFFGYGLFKKVRKSLI